MRHQRRWGGHHFDAIQLILFVVLSGLVLLPGFALEGWVRFSEGVGRGVFLQAYQDVDNGFGHFFGSGFFFGQDGPVGVVDAGRNLLMGSRLDFVNEFNI